MHTGIPIAKAAARAEVPTADTAISLRGVCKRFGSLLAVDGVDLDIRRGEVFGLIGHNGAGKSTLFKMMLGLLTPSAGTILLAGAPVSGAGARAVRRGIGYLPENVVLWDNLSGLETLRFFARLKAVPASECAPALAKVGLEAAAARPVREYSKGMRQRLGFAQALLGRPRVLFLDEPTTGLDPHAIRAFWDTLAGLREQGVTIVISSHILAELQHRVDRLAVLASGRVHALGSVQQLRDERNLPLTVTLHLAGRDLPEAERALAPLAAATAGLACERCTEGLRVRCPRQAKVALLQALAPLGERLLDLQIAEPSLEDLFFGPSGRREA
mgnify:CR=1 FL=1